MTGYLEGLIDRVNGTAHLIKPRLLSRMTGRTFGREASAEDTLDPQDREEMAVRRTLHDADADGHVSEPLGVPSPADTNERAKKGESARQPIQAISVGDQVSSRLSLPKITDDEQQASAGLHRYDEARLARQLRGPDSLLVPRDVEPLAEPMTDAVVATTQAASASTRWPMDGNQSMRVDKPTITVTIGRIELHGSMPPPKPKRPSKQLPKVRLDDYLRFRHHGKCIE